MNNEILGGDDPSHAQFVLSESPENDPFQPITLSSREQQEAVFSGIYNSLRADTRAEVYGTLKDEAVAINDVLREFMKPLAVSLGKDKEYQPEEWLYVGVTDFIPQNLLYEWTSSTEADTLFQKVARYFQEKQTK